MQTSCLGHSSHLSLSITVAPKTIPNFSVRHRNRWGSALDLTQCSSFTFFMLSFPHLFLTILQSFGDSIFFYSFSCHSFILLSLDRKASFFWGGGTSAAYGSSWARSPIGAVDASRRHSHTNARFDLCLQPTPQLTPTPDP